MLAPRQLRAIRAFPRTIAGNYRLVPVPCVTAGGPPHVIGAAGERGSVITAQPVGRHGAVTLRSRHAVDLEAGHQQGVDRLGGSVDSSLAHRPNGHARAHLLPEGASSRAASRPHSRSSSDRGPLADGLRVLVTTRESSELLTCRMEAPAPLPDIRWRR